MGGLGCAPKVRHPGIKTGLKAGCTCSPKWTICWSNPPKWTNKQQVRPQRITMGALKRVKKAPKLVSPPVAPKCTKNGPKNNNCARTPIVYTTPPLPRSINKEVNSRLYGGGPTIVTIVNNIAWFRINIMQEYY